VAGAVLVYFFWALLLIAQKPGLQHDEALLVTAAVHMLYAPHEIDVTHEANDWISVMGHPLPLMTATYVGAVKEYVCLPLFRVLGTRASVIRLASVLLAAILILGIGVVIGREISWPTGAAAALLVAMNPAYTAMTVFDNNAVAASMAALGLLLVAISRYLRKRGAARAAWIGVAIGFGIWARANFAWVLVALGAAVLIMLGKRALRTPISHWLAAIAGGLVGGAPFLIYQVVSNFATWRTQNELVAGGAFRQWFIYRLDLLAEVLLSDVEHRQAWSGPDTPGWQYYLFPTVMVLACLVVFAVKARDARQALWGRIAALALVFLSAMLLVSRLRVAQHHMIMVVPLACALAALAGAILAGRFRWGVAVAGALGALYIGSALYWQVSAVRGLAKTGGVGVWSDAINDLARHLDPKYSGEAIKVLDWGLAYNLGVLSHGRLRLYEIYGDGLHQPWPEEILKGGVFIMNAPENRQFPKPTAAFLRALAACRPEMSRYAVMQRNHAGYAMVLDIVPNTAREVPAEAVEAQGSSVSTGDAAAAGLLSGFHQIEGAGWRWTGRNFSITLNAPDPPSIFGARLLVQLYIAGPVIQKLGGTTLSARVHGHSLAPETYRQTGQYTFTREIPPEWLTPGPNRFEFSLDKAIPPASGEPRELGIVVQSASLEPK
jgi:4-amino-4-deoxy-L-arabinose transferase-like glycosyltransferase